MLDRRRIARSRGRVGALGANPRKRLRRAPDAPLSAPQCDCRRIKGVVGVPLHVEQPLPEWRQRQERGLRTPWKFGAAGPDLLKIESGAQAKSRERGPQLAGWAGGESLLGVHRIMPKRLQRNK